MPHARGAGYGATRGDGDDDDDEWIRPRTNRRDPCLRTAAVNIHNGEATGSASGRQYVYAKNDGRIRLSNSLPSSTKFVIAKA